MIKIGLIIDKYHLERKVTEFLKYIKSQVDLNLYVEEDYLLDLSDTNFDEDIFFVKAKGDLILGLVKQIERNTSIPVINSSKSIWLAFNRFLNSTLLRRAGILVPNFSINPLGVLPPFHDYIIKNVADQKNYSFKPKIEKKNGNLAVTDERAINEAIGGKEHYNYLYYQEFIKSKWEYKVYVIGNEFLFYKQIPILVNPNKMKSRKRIDETPELREITSKAIECIDLKIASIDFLQDKKGDFYLTDINSSPNFNYIKDGPKIVGDYLINQAKK
ncbi:MAG: RimK family alpha-L-glutamate ligase [Candidatus Thorarchaeota archaeon]